MKDQPMLAASLYGAARGTLAGAADPGRREEGGGLSFSEALGEAARAMERTLREGEAAAAETVSGNGDVQSLVEALTATEMALETAVTVRDRVVEAYQEILRMPV